MNPVTVTIQNNIALVEVNNPPVNALSNAVRSGIMDAIKETEKHSEVDKVILYCGGGTFIAGADIREFNLPPQEPHLPDVISALENSDKPWIAAIHGTALGGGLELTLGCDYRVALNTAKLGLPEVNLGLIPGSGGTARLPRLIAADSALEMVTGGKPISAEKALKLGLIDHVVADDLIAAAVKFSDTIKEKRIAVSQREPQKPASKESWVQQKAKILTKARGQNSIARAADSIEFAVQNAIEDALAFERKTFLKLKEDPQSKAMRYIFFAERSATRLPELKDIDPLPLNTIGVIGGGTMGAGIAANCLLSGYHVVMIERDSDAAEAGKSRVLKILEGSQKRGLISEDKYKALSNSFSAAEDYAALHGADLVIEAVFEDLEVKKAVFAELEKHTNPQAILASNTSYLNINLIAETLKDPSRVIGLHFFSPAHIMKLLEIVITDEASPAALATGFELGKRLRKITIPSGVCDGFIANRTMSAYRKECDYMLQDGALPHEIDAAMRDFGFPMGIFEMQDLAGLDIGWANRKRLAPTRDPNERYVAIADKLCEMGRFGRKTGKGWYVYNEAGKAETDPAVIALIEKDSSDAGITRTPISSEDIMARILAAMQSEAKKVLEEGIAKSPEAIDVVMVNGYSFPRWRGGPMHMLTENP